MILKLLNQEFNPYVDNTAKYQELTNKSSNITTTQQKNTLPVNKNSTIIATQTTTKQQEIKKTVTVKQHDNKLTETKEQVGMKISKALSFDLKLKTITLRSSSLRSYKSHINVFENSLKKNKKKTNCN